MGEPHVILNWLGRRDGSSYRGMRGKSLFLFFEAIAALHRLAGVAILAPTNLAEHIDEAASLSLWQTENLMTETFVVATLT